MSKKTLWKDVRKSISKSKGRYISIISLVALGSFALVGLQVAGPDMRITGEHYFNDQNAADLTVIGDLGIDEDNVNAINKVSGAKDIEYGYLKDVCIKDTLTGIRVYSVTPGVSDYELVDGTMPQNDDEIAIASFLSDDYKIGDEITLDEKEDSAGETVLKNHTFKITGYVNSCELLSIINMGNSTSGTGELMGYAAVTEDAFDSEVYMLARITFNDTTGVDPYSDEYADLISSHKEELSNLLDDQPQIRLDSIKSEYQEKIDDGETQISDAEKELSDAENKLSDGKKQLDDAKSEVKDAQKELDESVNTAQKELYDSAELLHEGNEQIKEAEQTLEEGKTALDDGYTKLNSAKKELASKKSEITEAEKKIESGEKELADKKSEYEASLSEYNTKYSEYKKAVSEINAAETELNEAWDEYYKSENELKAANKKYSDAIDELTSNINKLEAAEKAGAITDEQEAQLAMLRNKLDTAKSEYQSFKETTYNQGISTLEKSKSELESKSEELSKNKEILSASKEELDSAKTKLNSAKSQISEAEVTLSTSREELDSAKGQIKSSENEIKSSENTLAQKQKEYDDGVKELSDNKQTLAEKKQEYNNAQSELSEKKAEAEQKISDAKQEIADKQKEYDDSLAEYNEKKPDAEQKIANAKTDLEKAKTDLNNLKLPVYSIDSRREIPGSEGYRTYATVSEIIDSLADVFPIFLYLVAALVTLTTMTRFVDEERINSGTLKALGYSNKDIIKKFVFYGSSASFFGACIGIAAGHTLIPIIVYNAYGAKFTLPKLELHFYSGITITAFICAFICAVIPAYLVAVRELKEKPSALLQPKPPAAGSEILLEHIHPIWNRMNFTHKVTARNIFRYKKRMLMTIFGVCGAGSLLFSGLGVQYSISQVNDRQFGDIIKYDIIVAKNDNLSEDEENEFENLLCGTDIQGSTSVVYNEMTKEENNSSDKQTVKLIASDDTDNFNKYIGIYDRKSGNEIKLSDNGVIISERLSDFLKVKAGDEITLNDDEGIERKMTVSAVCEMYTGHFAFMSKSYYEKVFETEYVSNANLVTLSDGSIESTNQKASEFIKLDGTKGVVQNTSMINQVDTIVKSLNKIMDILVLVAALLAMVILYNLNNINVSERIRELSTIKVLGFYDKEVTMYIYRETILLTILGIFAGFALGDALFLYILHAVPPADVMFSPTPGAKAFLAPAIVISVITLILGYVINRKLRNVDMLGALKSVD